VQSLNVGYADQAASGSGLLEPDMQMMITPFTLEHWPGKWQA
jgi:hypothetical protein